MDGIQTSETSTASVETTASPAVTTDSSVSVEANQIAQPTPEAPSVPVEPSGSSSTANSDEWPDDAAMAAMSGQERSSHWQNLRSRYDDAIKQLAEWNAQAQQVQPPPQSDESNWVSPDLLFAPKIDPRTGQPFVDSRTGEPITSPAPFLEKLRAESPNTFADMVWESMNTPWSEDESTASVLLRDYYGLKPELIETYRQIQSPEDAQAFNAGPVDVSHIPQPFQELYKSLDWDTRDQIDSIPDDATRNLALRGLNAEFEQKQAVQAQQREIAAERQRVQQERTIQLSEEIGKGARQLVRQQFNNIQLTGDQRTDDLLWNILLNHGQNALLEDSAGNSIVQKVFGENGLIPRGEAHLARSNQALIASNVARLLKEPIEAISSVASKARKWDEYQRQQATPRAEIGASSSNGSGLSPANSNNGLQPTGRSSLFNAEEVAQLAAMTKAAMGG